MEQKYEKIYDMSDPTKPRPYEQWRTTNADRGEDAANTFGYYLIRHCRAEALKRSQSEKLPTTEEACQARVEAAVDLALHNVMDLLEGFWPTPAGPNYTAEFALSVCIKDANDTPVEDIQISPCLLDLPIGYWNWKKDFR